MKASKETTYSQKKIRDYRDPDTRLGIGLGQEQNDGNSNFLVHECGCLHYENWNHKDIESPYWRVHYNFQAGNAIELEDRTIDLHPDHCLIIPENIRFSTRGPESPLHCWIHFNPSKPYLTRGRSPIIIPLDRSLKGLWQSYTEVYQETEKPDSSLRRLHHHLQSLLHYLFSTIPENHFRTYSAQAYQILQYINSHIQDDLSNSVLSQELGMSLEKMNHWFRINLESTPSKYITRLRVQRASQMLSLTEKSIDEIADANGFPNRFYFSRVFQKHLGMGPATYRKKFVK